MKGFPDLPPIWWLGSIAVIYLGKYLAPGWHIDIAVFTLGSKLILAGALFIIAWSGIWFYKKKTPIEPHHQPKTLIKEGPYRLSRNPIYLSLILLTCASALGHGSVLGLVCAAILWWVLNRRFVLPEEAALLRAFGREAEAYFKATRRWI
ncbi:MAG: isoprenylcysteine carboxylmethyltransferase family protein [Sulfitobacter sp.]